MNQARQLFSISVFAFVISAGPTVSADLGGSIKDDPAPFAEVVAVPQWTFKFTTYTWLPWVTGDVAVKGRPLSVDASPDDIIGSLDWSGIPAWMSYFEARNGRLALFNDINYSKLAGSASFARVAQLRRATLELAGQVEADYEQAVVEFGAAYELWSNGNVATGASAFDILGGGRYWYQNSSFSADLNATLNAAGPRGIVDLEVSRDRVIAKSGSVDWIDPFIGARVRYQMAPGQLVVVRGDVGGFDIGSDFTWHAIGTYEFKLFERAGYDFDAYIGYKALSVDYSEGSGNGQYRFDALQHGPVLGGTLRF